MKWMSDNTCSTVLSNNLVDLHIILSGRIFCSQGEAVFKTDIEECKIASCILMDT